MVKEQVLISFKSTIQNSHAICSLKELLLSVIIPSVPTGLEKISSYRVHKIHNPPTNLPKLTYL